MRLVCTRCMESFLFGIYQLHSMNSETTTVTSILYCGVYPPYLEDVTVQQLTGLSRMENVTIIHLLACFIHLIWYFTGLLSELSLLVLSASISRLSGIGLPTRLFSSIFLIGAILMILFPFHPQYEPPHEYYENVNAHLYEALEHHLYRQSRPPVIGDDYPREVGRTTIKKNLTSLSITFNDSMETDDSDVSTITEHLSETEVDIVDIPHNSNKTPLDLFDDEEINEVQLCEVRNEGLQRSGNYSDIDLELIKRIREIELSNVNQKASNEIVLTNSSSSREINLIGCDTIGRIESVVSIIEPDISPGNSDNQLDNENNHKRTNAVEEFRSAVDRANNDDKIL